MLSSISPIDGRYHKTTEPLAQFFSEQALMKYRLVVEGEYLIALADAKLVRKLSDNEKKLIRALYNLSGRDAQIFSDIETKGYKNIKATDHDVKAVEYYMKDKLSGSSLKDVLEYIHFALTSYDTNTIARNDVKRPFGPSYYSKTPRSPKKLWKVWQKNTSPCRCSPAPTASPPPPLHLAKSLKFLPTVKTFPHSAEYKNICKA